MNITQLNQKIKKSNSNFKRKTLAEKRVLIAKDALELFKLGKISIERGQFVSFDSSLSVYNYVFEISQENELQKLLPKIHNCKVCALGGLMISKANLYNDCKLSVEERDLKYLNPRRIKNIPYFTKYQSQLIETAFEMGEGYFGESGDGKYYLILKEKDKNKAINFGYKYSDDDDRFVAIMKNIIKNKGTFKP